MIKIARVRLSYRGGFFASQSRSWLSTCRFLADGSLRVESDRIGDSTSPGPGQVSVKLRAAPCTPADLRTLSAAAGVIDDAIVSRDQRLSSPPSSSSPSSSLSPLPSTSSSSSPHHLRFGFPFVGGSEALWEVTATGEGVTSLRPGDLAVPTVPDNPPGNVPETGTWRPTATLGESSLVRVPDPPSAGGGGGIESEVAAHVSGSVATAIRILTDFSPTKGLEKGDRVVFTGASSAVAQILLQLAAARGLESVCLVSSEEEAALAMSLGAWKAAQLKEFKAMRMDNACLVADGEGGVLGFTAARALCFRGVYVSYADASGGGISLPVAGQIFSDTRCRGFSLARWAVGRPAAETRSLVEESLLAAASAGLRLEDTRRFELSEATAAVEAAGTPGGPVLLRG